MMTSRIDLNTRWRRGISWRGRGDAAAYAQFTDGLRDKVLQRRHALLAWLRKAFSQVGVRFLREGVWNGRSRRLVRVRRPGHRYRVRLRDEQNGLSLVERPPRARSSPHAVPQHHWCPAADLVQPDLAGRELNVVSKQSDMRVSQTSYRRHQCEANSPSWAVARPIL
jgi:hypothetical protein